jgi:hypothetical protein
LIRITILAVHCQVLVHGGTFTPVNQGLAHESSLDLLKHIIIAMLTSVTGGKSLLVEVVAISKEFVKAFRTHVMG